MRCTTDPAFKIDKKRRIIMKATFIALLVVSAAVLILAFPVRSYAQDTLEVPNIIGTEPVGAINITILGDTLSNGQPKNPNRVYRLARGLVYYASGTMQLRRNVVIIANDQPAATKPPVIGPAILQDGSTAPAPLFQFYKNATLKNLYITRIRPDTSNPQGDYSTAININGDSTRIIIKGCIFDGWGSGSIFKGAIFTKIYITDCVFRNQMNGGGSWFGGWAFESGATPGDTVVMVNNTHFNCGSYLFVPNRNITTYSRVEHNTMFTNHVNPLYAPYMSNATVRSNIFYGTLAMGQTQAEISGGWFDWKSAPSSTISIDTLPPTLGFPEANRKVVVSNNVYFWPQAYVDQWHTVFKDTLTPPVWMNARTLGMYADKTHWPNLGTPANNQNVDPGFDAALTNTIVTKILAFCRRNRGDLTAPNQHYYMPTGTDLYNVPWPLPENLAYSNIGLKTAGHDGFPVGDLNWFPADKARWLLTDVKSNPNGTLPDKFELSQNYPNPFNPATKISYALGQSGKVSLKVYSITGQLVQTVLDGVEQARGSYSVDVNMNTHASGAYFYVLQQGANRQARVMMLLK
jgi:hypothetical protein